LPAASKARLLTCPSEVLVKVCRSDPSGLRHCTRPSARDTNTSPTPAGGAFETVMATEDEVPVLLAASRATAASVCAPSAAAVVSQVTEYGAVVSSVPRGTPSSRNWTPATPTSSAAVAVTVMVPETLDPGLGDVTDAVGGVVSGGGPFDTVTVAEEEPVLPAPSRATALTVWLPLPELLVSQVTA
jgi:hypothetical protein